MPFGVPTSVGPLRLVSSFIFNQVACLLGGSENPDQTGLDQRSILQGRKISHVINIYCYVFTSSIVLIHYSPCSNSKHAVAMVEQHEVSTVEQLTKLKHFLMCCTCIELAHTSGCTNLLESCFSL